MQKKTIYLERCYCSCRILLLLCLKEKSEYYHRIFIATVNELRHIGMADYLQIHFDKGYFMSSSNSFDPVGSIYDNIDPYTYVIRP